MFGRNVEYEASYVGLEAGGSEEIVSGLRWLAARVTNPSDITVVAPTRDHFRSDDVLARLPAGVQTETPRTLKRYSPAKAVLACWPTQEDLDLLDGLPKLEAMCVIVWLPDESLAWRQARQAIDLTGRTPAEPQPTLADPVVVAAMRSLTNRVNLSTGLGHPRDRSAAIHAFRILKRAGHPWIPENIKAWAMANGWPAESASDLAEIAAGVIEGKRYRAGGSSWADDILKQWRSRAE